MLAVPVLDGDYFLDLWHCLLEHLLNTPLEGYLGHRSVTAGAGKPYFDRSIGDIHQLYITAVSLQGGPYPGQGCFYFLFHISSFRVLLIEIAR